MEEIKLTVDNCQVSDQEIDEYAREQVDSWDMDSLVTFVVDTLYNEFVNMDRKRLLEDMAEYYGEDWLRRKKLEAFK